VYEGIKFAVFLKLIVSKPVTALKNDNKLKSGGRTQRFGQLLVHFHEVYLFWSESNGGIVLLFKIFVGGN